MKMTLNSVWVKHDASDGTRQKRDGDCQVRALVTARELSYHEAWDALYDLLGRSRQPSGFSLEKWLDAYPIDLGVVRKLSFPAQRRKPRMTAVAFCAAYPHGRFILRMPHHVAAVVDGKLYDVWNSSRKCVYTAWEVRTP